MKVKELKEILSKCDDEASLLVLSGFKFVEPEKVCEFQDVKYEKNSISLYGNEKLILIG